MRPQSQGPTRHHHRRCAPNGMSATACWSFVRKSSKTSIPNNGRGHLLTPPAGTKEGSTPRRLPSPGGEKKLSPERAALLPLAFATALLGLAWWMKATPSVALAMVGAAAVLLGGAVFLGVHLGNRGRVPRLMVALRRPHYVQMIAQTLLWGYWAYWVEEVRAFAPLILAQLLFAYGFSALLAWSRRDRHELGLGPVPIVLSINFFLIFKPEWFAWQFVIVALGYLAKEFIRWERAGRSAHVFNPSSFPLAVFSLVLIFVGATDTTLGLEIATTLFYPPSMYLVIFLVALPGQLLFGVATMTIAAVLATCAFGLVFQVLTGGYYFFDAYVPIAVFLGMHLLFTDPSTSPRSEGGRIVFGIMYGGATIALAGLLSALGAPTFYDKLIPIPILNLTVRYLDGAFGPKLAKGPRAVPLASPMRGLRHRLTTTAIWSTAFLVLALSGLVGDEHEGQWVPFWDQACADGSERACEYLATIEENFCEEGSGWACNELGALIARRASSPTADEDARRAHIAFTTGCDLGQIEACSNADILFGAVTMGDGADRALTGPDALVFLRGELAEQDLPILLRGSKGPIRDPSSGLLERACSLGFPASCSGT